MAILTFTSFVCDLCKKQHITNTNIKQIVFYPKDWYIPKISDVDVIENISGVIDGITDIETKVLCPECYAFIKKFYPNWCDIKFPFDLTKLSKDQWILNYSNSIGLINYKNIHTEKGYNHIFDINCDYEKMSVCFVWIENNNIRARNINDMSGNYVIINQEMLSDFVYAKIF